MCQLIFILFLISYLDFSLAARNYDFVIKEFIYEANPEWINIKSTLKTDKNNVTVHDCYVEQLKDVPNKYITNVFMEALKNGTYVPTMVKFKLDGCQILGGGKVIRNPILGMMLTIVRKFGKFPKSCPIKKDTYFVRNLKIDSEYGPPIIFTTHLRFNVEMTHLVGAKIIKLFSFRYILEVVYKK